MFYHLLLTIKPSYCSESYQKSIVISEDPMEWEERMTKHHPILSANVAINQFREISKKLYVKFKKNNPRKPTRHVPLSIHTLVMNREDYSDG